MESLLQSFFARFHVSEDSLDITNRHYTIKKHFRLLKAISIAYFNFFLLHSSIRTFLKGTNEPKSAVKTLLFTSRRILLFSCKSPAPTSQAFT